MNRTANIDEHTKRSIKCYSLPFTRIGRRCQVTHRAVSAAEGQIRHSLFFRLIINPWRADVVALAGQIVHSYDRAFAIPNALSAISSAFRREGHSGVRYLRSSVRQTLER